jgi:predicted nucleic acid-binding protein
MAKYLIDTNVVLRFCNASDSQHTLAGSAISHLLATGNECYLTAQVLIELWVVATRPANVNGLGWTTERTKSIIDQLLYRFPMLEDSPQIFPCWLELVTVKEILGKRAHDSRLVSIMLTSKVTHLLTFNGKDFNISENITIVHPQDCLPSSTIDAS